MGIDEDVLPGGVYETPQCNQPQPDLGQQGYTNRNPWEIMATTIGDDASTNSDGTHNPQHYRSGDGESTRHYIRWHYCVSGVIRSDGTVGFKSGGNDDSHGGTTNRTNPSSYATNHDPTATIYGGGRGGRGGNRGYVDRGASYNIPNTGFVGYAPPPTGGFTFTTGTNHISGRRCGRRKCRVYGTVAAANLVRYVGCRRVVFVAQTATFCVVSATCRDTSLVMSQTQENVVSAGCPKRKTQQLGLGITHAFSTLIININSFKKLVHSQTSPAFDHYDFLLPRDQIVGLLLDNSLDVEM